MQQWQYKTIILNDDATADTNGVTLDEYGRDGWEIVRVFDGPNGTQFALLKRPKRPVSVGPAHRIQTKG
jgi:hypothetical protein